MVMLWKWVGAALAGLAAVAVGIGLGIGLSQTFGSDQHATRVVGDLQLDKDEPFRPQARADGVPHMTGHSLGPIELGMSRQKALATGWLGDSQTNCSDIIGEEGSEPGEYNYQLGGDDLPDSLSGHVEFVDNQVSLIQVDSDVELPNGLIFNSTWDNPAAELSFVGRGYTFNSGEFYDSNDAATVRSPSGDEFGMYFSYADGSAFVSIPEVIMCD